MGKDYYLILGINRNADEDQIRRAYRKAVKDCHPDTSQAPDKDKFIEIQEAYETLCDPVKKKAYDSRLTEKVITTPYTSRFEGYSRPIKRREDALSYIEKLFDQFLYGTHDFCSLNSPDARRAELILTPREAREGGTLSLSVPATKRCVSCSGTGGRGMVRCTRCGGKGTMTGTREISIDIPAGIKDGSIIRVPLESTGGEEIILKIIVYQSF